MTPMARLTDRGYTTTDADEFMKRANRSHTVKWKAGSYRWVAGEQETIYENLPIVGGTLTMDSSEPTRRWLTLEVAGVGQLVPDSVNDPLAPFGQYLKLWVRIDRDDGSWFPWIKMGEFPIQTTSSEWPSMVQTVECGDYSVVVDDFLHQTKRSYNHLSVKQAVKQLTEDALPDSLFTIHADAAADSTNVEPHTIAEAATSRWETATMIAAARGFETFFDSQGNLVIRKDVTRDNDETIPGAGPDIGTVSNPVAIIKDGQGGNLVAITQSVTREGGCNGVFINLHATPRQQLCDEGDAAQTSVQVSALADGPIAWGDRYGRQPIVIEKLVKRITSDVEDAQQRRADRLLQRRGGVVRTLDLDAVGLYWLEPDDKVRIIYDGRTEAHYVGSIEFDLTGENPARIRTRSLAVEDPGT